MPTPVRTILLVAPVLMAVACGRSAPPDPGVALKSIRDQDLVRDVTVLASDEYEGRKPGTRGEDLTVAYVERRFREIGLAPGNPDGSYVQRVPLVAVTSAPTALVTIRGQQMRRRTPQDFVARSVLKQDPVTIVESEMVFVGYGIEAPEYGWNDYEGVDVKGKTLLLLLGEPSRPAPAGSAKSDPGFFKGSEQSYYGTPRFKRDAAVAKGAAADVFVLGIGAPIAYQPQPGFRATPLGITMSVDLALRTRAFDSRNVIAKLEGSDPRVRDEYIVFSAHWDAFGRDSTLTGDQIRNGAIDNALGVAQLLEIAEAFKKLSRPPRRSILFLATTAGLLGAR